MIVTNNEWKKHINEKQNLSEYISKMETNIINLKNNNSLEEKLKEIEEENRHLRKVLEEQENLYFDSKNRIEKLIEEKSKLKNKLN